MLVRVILCKFIKGHSGLRLSVLPEQVFDPAYSVGVKQHVVTFSADISRYPINDDYAALVLHGMKDLPQFIFARTPTDTAFHVVIVSSG